jgi:alkylation response protein AidB-like acyl-CoA dehydrogenase
VANFFDDNDDLKFYLDAGVDWAALTGVLEGDFKDPEGPKSHAEALESYRDILSLVGGYIAEQIMPHVAQIDKAGLHLQDGEVVEPAALTQIFEGIKEMGLHGIVLPRELGGMQMPTLNYFIIAEMLARADVSIMTHNSFHSAMALAMLLYSIDEGSTDFDPATGKILKTRFPEEMAEIARGDAWGSMDITEPNAGSDMAALASRAEQDAQGNWTVTGQKIFITSGHAKYHFVIARTEPAGTEGLKGLSLFLVKAFEKGADGATVRHATVDRLEEKLGHHASATCSVIFERSPATLIGRRGDGFRGMLLLMNNARLGVGFESIGVCEAAFRMARDYAAQRRSMGKTIDKHELIADYLDEMATDIQGLRALAMYGAFNEEMATHLETQARWKKLPELEHKRRAQAIKKHRRRSRRMTPLLKYLAAEKAVAMARSCIQIHGGVGYTQEYGAEKLLRDSLVAPIYEGTSQIQSLMAMKDTLMAVIKDPKTFVQRSAQHRWRALSARDPLERRVAKVQALCDSAVRHLLTHMMTDKLRGKPISNWAQAISQSWDPRTDFAFAMLHSERLTKILTDTLICEVLLEQAKSHPQRRDVLERYLERAEPRCRGLLDEMHSTGTRLLSKLSGEAGGQEARKQA